MLSVCTGTLIVLCLLLPDVATSSDVDRLIRVVRSGDEWERMVAIEEIIALGPLATKAVPVLVDRIRTSSDTVTREARALVAIGKPAIVPLEALLADMQASARARSLAATALGDIGPPSLDVLIRALSDEEVEVRCAATAGLGYTQREEAMASLVKAANDEHADVRRCAAVSIGEIGVQPELALRTLGRLLNDNEEWVRIKAAEAMRNYPRDLDITLPYLVHASRDRCISVRIEAIHGLRLIAERHETARAAIVDRLKDPFWEVREAAAIAVKELGPKYVEAVPELVDVILWNGPSVLDRFSAIRALESIGPDAFAALPVLHKVASDHPDDYIREAADSAISQIVRPDQMDRCNRWMPKDKGEGRLRTNRCMRAKCGAKRIRRASIQRRSSPHEIAAGGKDLPPGPVRDCP